jgi:replication factor A1
VKPLVIYVVQSLQDKLGGVDIRLRILSKSNPRTVKTNDGQEHIVVDVAAGDRTGSVKISLWDAQINEIIAGDIIDLRNGYVNSFRGQLRLNIGKFGIIEKVDDSNFPTSEELNKRKWRRYTRRRMNLGEQL